MSTHLPSGRCVWCGLQDEDCRCCPCCGNSLLYCSCVDEDTYNSYDNGDRMEDVDDGKPMRHPGPDDGE